MASVKVAVRVRPLNKRERDMDAKTCIFMEDKKTVISNFHAPGASCDHSDKKDFTFDFSYWSADSSDKHYASQEQKASYKVKQEIKSERKEKNIEKEDNVFKERDACKIKKP
ncbi:Kinesin-like protein KIF16B [Exaiptasia diaphana]|nr:Kinesin-like protein KIF16B [Exaiptasia diaphana]